MRVPIQQMITYLSSPYVPATVLILAAVLLVAPHSQAADKPVHESFQAFLIQVDAAQRELQKGRPVAFKALWSHSEDITLSGGFGGTIEKGWEQIGKRLDWVGAQFTQGTNTIERLSSQSSGDLGYTVQIEHIRFIAPGQAQASTRDYRVTMIFRRELGRWRLVHRHADSQMVKQGPK